MQMVFKDMLMIYSYYYYSLSDRTASKQATFLKLSITVAFLGIL